MIQNVSSVYWFLDDLTKHFIMIYHTLSILNSSVGNKFLVDLLPLITSGVASSVLAVTYVFCLMFALQI